MDDLKLKEFILFLNRSKVNALYKSFLIIIEDLRDDDRCISEEKFQKIRKRILDSGNDCIREFEQQMENLIKD